MRDSAWRTARPSGVPGSAGPRDLGTPDRAPAASPRVAVEAAAARFGAGLGAQFRAVVMEGVGSTEAGERLLWSSGKRGQRGGWKLGKPGGVGKPVPPPWRRGNE